MKDVEFFIGAYELSHYVRQLDYTRGIIMNVERGINSAMIRINLGNFRLEEARRLEDTVRPRVGLFNHINIRCFNPVFIGFCGYRVLIPTVYKTTFQTHLYNLFDYENWGWVYLMFTAEVEFERGYPVQNISLT